MGTTAENSVQTGCLRKRRFTTPNTILVTGATGDLGREVVTHLLKNGSKVRAATRHPEKAKFPEGVKAVRTDYNGVSSVEEAVRDVYGVFLIAPPTNLKAEDKLNPTIDGAKKAGVMHIAFKFVFGAGKAEESAVRKVKHYLMYSGDKYTIIRPNFFMENFSNGFVTPTMVRPWVSFLPKNTSTRNTT